MELYRSRAYAPEYVKGRYVQWWPAEGRFKIYEVNAANLTLRELASDGADLPPLVAELARQRADLGIHPCQVRLA